MFEVTGIVLLFSVALTSIGVIPYASWLMYRYMRLRKFINRPHFLTHAGSTLARARR